MVGRGPRERDVYPWANNLLGVVATEAYAEEVLVPLMRNNPPPRVKDNLRAVLEECGRRHGRRYLTIEDRVVG